MTTHKVKKKKQRERLVKEKMTRRHIAIVKARSLEKKEKEEQDTIDSYKHMEEAKDRSRAEVMAKLEENAKVLKALEDAYEKEKGSRVDLGKEAVKQLEELGEKMNMPKLAEKDEKICGYFQHADEKSHPGRIYPRELWKKNVDELS